MKDSSPQVAAAAAAARPGRTGHPSLSQHQQRWTPLLQPAAGEEKTRFQQQQQLELATVKSEVIDSNINMGRRFSDYPMNVGHVILESPAPLPPPPVHHCSTSFLNPPALLMPTTSTSGFQRNHSAPSSLLHSLCSLNNYEDLHHGSFPQASGTALDSSSSCRNRISTSLMSPGFFSDGQLTAITEQMMDTSDQKLANTGNATNLETEFDQYMCNTNPSNPSNGRRAALSAAAMIEQQSGKSVLANWQVPSDDVLVPGMTLPQIILSLPASVDVCSCTMFFFSLGANLYLWFLQMALLKIFS
jgi:hypothetical protein